MNNIKVLSSLLLGTIVYVLVAFVGGANGVLSYNKLSEQKKSITRQTELIQNINNELSLEYTALLRDKDVIAAYARRLDYVGYGEKLVKVNGLKASEKALYDTGSVLRHTESTCLSEKFCKACGLAFFILSLILFLLIDLSRGNITITKKKESVIKGIPVYDLQQI
ncbi:MAG: septum formation initiator family protein [Treponema sp.]|nr:septum formation initiator family protein [Treponema sp.]